MTPSSSLSVLIYAAVLLVIIFAAKVFAKPLKAIFRLFLNSLFGCALILIINTIYASFGLQIAINAVTVAICAFLGVSGVAFLTVFNLVL